MNYKEIIQHNNLDCSVEDFENYYDSVVVDVSDLESAEASKHTFGELYNGIEIENPGNGKYYYVLGIAGVVYLQNVAPFVGGNVGLNDENIDGIIEDHKQAIINEYVINKKLEKTIEHFSN